MDGVAGTTLHGNDGRTMGWRADLAHQASCRHRRDRLWRWYLLSALILAGVAIAAHRGCGPAFKAILPVSLTPIAVAYALLAGFLAADV
jgi:hypothetical protein